MSLAFQSPHHLSSTHQYFFWISSLCRYPCFVSSHTSYRLPHYGHGAAEGGRTRGKLLRDHTRMGPKLESSVSCQQHSGCQSRGSKNKQWKSKPEIYSFRLGFQKKKNVETSKFHENKHFLSLFCFQLVAISVCFKKNMYHTGLQVAKAPSTYPEYFCYLLSQVTVSGAIKHCLLNLW